MNLIEKIVGCLPEDMPSMLLDRTDNEIAVQHILRAITDAGYAIVPVEPTPDMLDAASESEWTPIDIWRAMLAAAPKEG